MKVPSLHKYIQYHFHLASSALRKLFGYLGYEQEYEKSAALRQEKEVVDPGRKERKKKSKEQREKASIKVSIGWTIYRCKHKIGRFWDFTIGTDNFTLSIGKA